MIKREINYFFTALMFFTRIPCPEIKDFKETYLQKSRRYFPLVGLVVGSILVICLEILHMFFSLELSLIITISCGILITGAFHEDGFADVCDGFGGGYGKENVLRIMKDSRVGAYGAIGIFLLLLIKFYSLVQIGNSDFNLLLLSVLSANSVSRFIASSFVDIFKYVETSEGSKSKPVASKVFSFYEFFFSLLSAALPLIFFRNYFFILAIQVAVLPAIYLGWLFKREIGGFTGDCLGAVQQTSELFFYLGVILICRFI